MNRLRDAVEVTLLGTTTGHPSFCEKVGNCVDILIAEGVLRGDESALEAIREVILQGIAEGP